LAVYTLLLPPNLPSYEEWNGREVVATGDVSRKEYRTSYGEKKVYLYLSNCSVIFTPERSPDYPEIKLKKIMVLLEQGQIEPAVGGTVCLRGKLESFEKAANPGEFDSHLYYGTLGISMGLKEGRVLWESEEHSILGEALWQLRCAASNKLDAILCEQDASVMKTMLLGDKETLDNELKEIFQSSGIAHILAVSGLHISLIGLGVYKLLRRLHLPVVACAPLCILVILGYGILTGAGVSSIRAVGMFILRMLAEALGRTYDLQTALGLLLLLMAAGQPLYFYQSGFLLSFASLLGIGCLFPALERGRREKPRYRQGAARRWHNLLQHIRKSLWAGLSVTLATMPIQLWYYYEIPMYSVLINLLVIPLMTVLMYCGAGLLLIPGGIWSLTGASVVHAILNFYQGLAQVSGDLPGSRQILGRPQVWQVIVYIGLLAAIVLLQKKVGRCWRLGLVAAAVLLLTVRVGGGFQVTFLDVGQGDCICVELENGANYLIDAGSSSKGNVGKYQIAPFLKHQGITYLDGIFITHPDEDHCNGLAGLLEAGYAGRTRRLILPDVADQVQEKGYLEILSLAADYEIPVSYLSAGMRWQEGDAEFVCLHPPEGYTGADTNACSTVLYVKQEAFSMLLTGDVEDEGESLLTAQLKEQGIRDVTVLKVAHHGSKYSTTDSFLNVLDPQIAVISCGKGNSYGHPHNETLARLSGEGAVILATPDYGAITIKAGEKIKVYRYRSLLEESK